MKTTLAALLALGVLTSCAGGPSPEAPLLVGLAARDITPPPGYGMSGYYHERGADGVRDALQAKAIAFRQGGVAWAIVVCDLCFITADLSDEVRRRASEKIGIPVSALCVSATHTHTGPEYGGDFRRWIEVGRPATGYPEALAAATADAVVAAFAALRPMRLDFVLGHQDPPVSFNRRFHMGGTKWSADFPHDLGESLKETLGPNLLTVFANGCCGDINHVNPRAKDRNKTEVIGRAIGESVKRALPARAPLVAPSLAAASAKVRLPLQRFSPEELGWAKDLVSRDRKGAKIPFLEEVKAYKILDATKEQCPKGGYEVTNSTIEPGGGEMLVEAALKLLKGLDQE